MPRTYRSPDQTVREAASILNRTAPGSALFAVPPRSMRSLINPRESRFFFSAALLASWQLCLCQPLPAQQTGVLQDLVFEEIARDLLRPIGITNASDGSGRLFINLQDGPIRIHDGGRLLQEPFLDITPRVGCCGERGLLGLAFHPDYESNGFFFLDYTDRSDGFGKTVISRFSVSGGNPNVADPDSEKVLLTFEQPDGTHNGGQLQFGPDGYLYIATGDGGSPDERGERAADLNSLFGKILRIDVNVDDGSGPPYAIPPSNPFAGREGAREEIWAYGLRNPWRFSFDRETGDMFIGDVGANRVEEVDFQPASSSGGENYGWPMVEAVNCPLFPDACEDEALTKPIRYHRHDLGCSVIGGYRYRGVEVPQLNGVYVYGDYCSGRLFAAGQVEGGWKELDRRVTPFDFTSFGEDEAGELYFTESYEGRVYRVVTDLVSPTVSSHYPLNAVTGGATLELSVVGTNFVPGLEVQWNSNPRPTAFIDNQHLRATILPSDIATEGTAEIKVVNPRLLGGTAPAFEFPVRPAPAAAPAVNSNGLVNAASFTAGTAVAAGMIASIFGSGLALDTESTPGQPLPNILGGTTVFFNGLRAPVFFASPGQLNVQIPWDLPSGRQASLTVRVGPHISNPVLVPVSGFSPGLFTTGSTGAGQGAILISGTGSLAAPAGVSASSRPVRKGEFLEIFANGLGRVTDTPASGHAAVAIPLSETTATPEVSIGGVQANVLFAGLAPGFIGLYQVNVQAPAGAPSGDAVALSLRVGGVESNVVTIAIE